MKRARHARPGLPLRWRSGALALGAAALLIVPLSFGGGGDEGVDIFPNGDPRGSGDGGMWGYDFGDTPRHGHIAIHGKTIDLDGSGIPYASGFVAGSHARTDLFLGEPGDEPTDAPTSLDLRTKGTRTLIYSAHIPPAAARSDGFVNFNGRFEIEDLDPTDGEALELRSRQRSPGVLTILLGKRSTHSGPIEISFTTIDQIVVENEPDGVVDLVALREEMCEWLGGSGQDVGVMLATTNSRGVDEVWAAFNVDDARALYDVEVRLAR